MKEWKKYKLSEIIEFTTGKLNSNAAVKDGKFPFFTCSPETYRINNYAFNQKAILLAGNNAEGNFNIKYYEGKFNAYQRTYVISPKSENQIDIHFLYYYIRLCLKTFKTISQGTSTKFLTAAIINNLPIHIPSLIIQKKISAILSSLDNKIELNRRINHNLEQQAKTLFKHYFVERPEALGDYTIGNLTEIAIYTNGLAMQKFRPTIKESGIPVLKIKELGQGKVDKNSERCSENIDNQYKVNDGDIIFSWSGTLMVKIWCGGKCGLNQHLFKVTSDKYPKWFYYFWTLHHLNKFIRIAQDKAVTMGHIKKGELGKAEVLIPNSIKLDDINKIMSPLLSQMITIQSEIRYLTSLRDILIPKLMSGELNIQK